MVVALYLVQKHVVSFRRIVLFSSMWEFKGHWLNFCRDIAI